MCLKLLTEKILFVFVVLLFFAKPACAIKIGLVEGVSQNYVAVSSTGIVFDGSTGTKLLDLQAMKKYYVCKNGNQIRISLNNRYLDLNSNYLVIKTDSNSFVSTKNKWYRGNLIVIDTSNGLTIINDVPLEYYLMSVVPSEMPSGWNLEAHKAQAIAARSYAIANMGKRAKQGYDLKDTPEDQAYGGASKETKKTNYAVLNTKGQVIVYNDKIIPAYYHASSGGQTLNSDKVWNKNLPFIRSVPSFDENLPKKGHGVGMSQNGANVLANYGYTAYQILGYFYKDVALKVIDSSL